MPVPCAHFWAERLYAKETYCEESDQGGEDSWKGLRIVNLAKAILEELSDKKAKKKCLCTPMAMRRNIQECRLHLQIRMS